VWRIAVSGREVIFHGSLLGPAYPGRVSARPVPERSPRLVLAAGSVLDAPAAEVLRVAAAAGFDGVGLRLSHDHALDLAEAAGVAALAAELGLLVHDVEVHRITDARREPGPLLELAAAAGARHLLVVSDLADERATVDEVARAVRLGEQAGVRVAVEYMAWTTPSGPDAARRLAEETGCGIVVDVLHHVRVGAGPEELARLVEAGAVGWVQVCDAPLTAPADLVDEARHHRLAPGQGELPLHELLAVVPDDVTWSVEVQSDRLAGMLDPARRAQWLVDATRAVAAGIRR
jgi:sugar phosphate isomerase/epimerase